MSRERGSVRLQNLRGILGHGCRQQSTSCTRKPSPSSTSSSSPTSSLGSSSSQSDKTSSSTSPHGSSCFIISPPVSQFDQPVGIQVAGLEGHTKVTLQAWTCSRWQNKEIVLVSYGHFYSDQQGNLDLNKDPSLCGSYTGVDPMGLFWSMGPLPGHRKDVRLVIRDVTKPLVITIAVFSGHLVPDDGTVAMTSHKPLNVMAVKRTVLAPGVKRIEIREGRVRGTLFLPPGTGAHPGVIDMFGAAGGLLEIRAALLAAHGFAALSLAFFRFEDLPKTLEEVQFDYFEEVAEWFSGHPSVKTGGVGVVGVSTGASLSLQMAQHCPQVKAVVAINGQPFRIAYDMLRHGQLFQPTVPMDLTRLKPGQEGYIIKDIYNVTEADYFPVWKSQAHVLLLACEDDQQVQWQQVAKLRDLYPAHQRHLIDVVVYPGAGHLLEPPYNPLCRYSYIPAGGADWPPNAKERPAFLWGGQPGPHTVAQLDAWRRTLTFLHTCLQSTDTALDP